MNPEACPLWCHRPHQACALGGDSKAQAPLLEGELQCQHSSLHSFVNFHHKGLMGRCSQVNSEQEVWVITWLLGSHLFLTPALCYPSFFIYATRKNSHLGCSPQVSAPILSPLGSLTPTSSIIFLLKSLKLSPFNNFVRAQVHAKQFTHTGGTVPFNFPRRNPLQFSVYRQRKLRIQKISNLP